MSKEHPTAPLPYPYTAPPPAAPLPYPNTAPPPAAPLPYPNTAPPYTAPLPYSNTAPFPAAPLPYPNTAPPPYTPERQPGLYKNDPQPMPPPPGPSITVTPLTPVGLTTVHVMPPLGSNSTTLVCPFCHAEIRTKTKTNPSNIAYISAIFLCAIGCFLGCCLIPFCIDSCKSTEHICPNCQSFLGKFSQH